MRRVIPSLLVLPLLLAACAHKKPAEATAVPVVAPPPPPPPPVASAPAARTCRLDVDCGDRQLCIRGQCVDITPDLAECSSARIHFDLDQADIHPDERADLERVARCLKADQGLHITIEGNADERGTDEYNMALGDKRATQVARYLEMLGVSRAQLRTVSFGKERPLCTEHDEECWAKNRRAALNTTKGHRR